MLVGGLKRNENTRNCCVIHLTYHLYILHKAKDLVRSLVYLLIFLCSRVSKALERSISEKYVKICNLSIMKPFSFRKNT